MVAMVTENQTLGPPERVIAAARRCFARYGVDRTTMQDIAKESGIGRTGVYRLGLTRREITEAAIVTRLRELGRASARSPTAMPRLTNCYCRPRSPRWTRPAPTRNWATCWTRQPPCPCTG